MSVVLINDKVTPTDLAKAKEDYGEYVKVVVDLETGMLTIGGQWHADGEKMLLEIGNQQANLWGGGVDLTDKRIEVVALINLRPNQGNDSQEILDPQNRKKFIDIVKEKFNL